MRKRHFPIIWLILLAWLLAACGGNAAPPAVEETPEPVQDAPIEAPPAQPDTAVAPAASTTAAESETAETEIIPAAAKPQFVEFYADW